ncbi:6329_t:CDS:2 [Racocetra persica]|uniref:6329_t:CDS:1 n=1 Tax=Racocetra persica TaxID=160502 RepID=A0ACA9LCA3_9GLOM|nr:6329_t:CDS:2 [Racocetra persica]
MLIIRGEPDEASQLSQFSHGLSLSSLFASTYWLNQEKKTIQPFQMSPASHRFRDDNNW